MSVCIASQATGLVIISAVSISSDAVLSAWSKHTLSGQLLAHCAMTPE